jgi:hypothetical protein
MTIKFIKTNTNTNAILCCVYRIFCVCDLFTILAIEKKVFTCENISYRFKRR